jgi:hypothetical protein
MRVFLLAIVMALLLGLLAAPAFAANPHDNSTGQPGKECGEERATSSPPGFGTGGFENAEMHYAGSKGTPSAANGSPHAVSQYDVACFQVTPQ